MKQSVAADLHTRLLSFLFMTLLAVLAIHPAAAQQADAEAKRVSEALIALDRLPPWL